MAQTRFSFYGGTALADKSLPEAMEEIARQFEEEHPEAQVDSIRIDNEDGWLESSIRGEKIHD